MRTYTLQLEPPAQTDQTVRACSQCLGELHWRYRVGVAWDRGLPYCATHGLVKSWAIISRDGDWAYGYGRVDNKGRLFDEPRDLAIHPLKPKREKSARHHAKKRPSPQRTLIHIDARDTVRLGPAAWPRGYGDAIELEPAGE